MNFITSNNLVFASAVCLLQNPEDAGGEYLTNQRDYRRRSAVLAPLFMASLGALFIAKNRITERVSASLVKVRDIGYRNLNSLAEFVNPQILNVDDLDEEDFTPLMKMANVGNLLAVEFLIESKANPDFQNATGRTALMYACDQGHSKVIETLVQAKANIEIQDRFTGTALLRAVRNRSFSTAALLIKAKANLEYQCKKGRTALFHACEFGNLKAVQSLIAADANINHRDKANITPLAWAVHVTQGVEVSKKAKIVNALLKAGAEVNIESRSALMYAINNDHLKITDSLLRAGASLRFKDPRGNTPFTLARAKGGEFFRLVLEIKKLRRERLLEALNGLVINPLVLLIEDYLF